MVKFEKLDLVSQRESHVTHNTDQRITVTMLQVTFMVELWVSTHGTILKH